MIITNKGISDDEILQILRNSIIRNVIPSRLPPVVEDLIAEIQANSDTLAKTVGQSIGFTKGRFTNWSKTYPKKSGYSYEERFVFWAEKGMVLFYNVHIKELCVPLLVKGYKVYSITGEGKIEISPMHDLLPMFPSKIQQALGSDSASKASFVLSTLNDLRQGKESTLKALKEINEYKGMQYRENIFANMDRDASSWKDEWEKAAPRNPELVFENQRVHVESVDELHCTPSSKETTSKPFKACNLEETTMTKAKTLKTNMIDVNKEAIKAVGYLNAGRASNKLIKEACRPILNAMFKPTFMQKLGMKFFNAKNPVDIALASVGSDLICAQLVQAILELREVENEHVREVSKAAITYSMLQVSEQVPFEKAIDDLVNKLESEAEGILSKITKK